MTIYQRTLALIAVSAHLAACGGGSGSDGDGDPPPQPPPPPPSNVGLDARPSNTACIAPARATGNSELSVERAFPNLSFTEPVAMLQAPGDDSRWFVIERSGVIKVFDNNPSAQTTSTFVDLRDRVIRLGQSEAGLLGVAFDPDFPATGRAYLNYIANSGGVLSSVTSEFTSPDGGLTLDPGSERVLLSIDKPFDNHNGGQLEFDQDGYLRIGLGDGGGGYDPNDYAQNDRILLGKMLRIDVRSQPAQQPYAIPNDNPNFGNSLCGANGTGAQACPEIFAKGLRNPWRWSIDRQTGTQWVADVGQGTMEEIDIVELGGNYGWDIWEGTECTAGRNNCETAGYTEPVASYDRSLGFSVTGGYVYRGSQNTELHGRYLFADFGSGMIASLEPDQNGGYMITPHVSPGSAPDGAAAQLSISAFGQANDNELYVLDFFPGAIYKLIFTARNGSGDNVPDQLSATGCIDTGAPGAPPLANLIPYSPNASFWSDGADKERWIGLPNGQNIAVLADGDWDFPNGSVLVKHFRLNSRLIETRLLMRHPDGVWGGYTYEWNAAETDATRVIGGRVVSVAGQDWLYPSESQCIQCHTQAAGYSLSLESAQLNRDHMYPQTGRTANQITTLNAISVLSPPVVEDGPAYANPFDTSLDLNLRVRAYLHINCSNCHRPQGPVPAGIDLRHDTALSQTGACDEDPSSGDLGIFDARIIAPGSSARSVLLQRMARRDNSAMPPLGSFIVDQAGVDLVTDWVNALTPSDCL